MENSYIQNIQDIIKNSNDLEYKKEIPVNGIGKMPLFQIKHKGNDAILKTLTKEQASFYQHLLTIQHINLEKIYEVNYSNNIFYSINEFIERPSTLNYKLYDSYYKPSINSLSLYDYINNYSMFEKTSDQIHFIPEKEALKLTLQIINGVEQLSNNGLVHGDLSPQNILLTDNSVDDTEYAAVNKTKSTNRLPNTLKYDRFKLKIIDFGTLRPEKPTEHPVTKVIGTKEFTAPEILAYNIPNDRVDIYSIGCLLHYMCLGFSPTEKGPDYAKAFLSPGVYNIIQICNNEYSTRYSSLKQLKKAVLRELRIPADSADRFLSKLPGFRTNKLWKKIIASLFYLWFIAYLLYTLIIRDFSFNTWFFIALCVFEVIFVCDAFDIGGKVLPYRIFRSKHPVIRFFIKLIILFTLFVIYWILWYKIKQ